MEYDNLPKKIQHIINEYLGDKDSLSYAELEELKEKLEDNNYTFEYGLSGTPHNFTKISDVKEKKSFLAIPNAKVLWQSDNWSIESIREGREIVASDGWGACYGLYSKKKNEIRWDFLPPRYIQSKALQLAKKHIVPVYDLK